MPRFYDEIPICGHNDLVCITRVRNLVQSKRDKEFACNCLPGCHEIRYDTRSSSVPMVRQAVSLNQFGQMNATIVRIFYADTHFRSQNKAVAFGFTDFLCKANK